MKNSKNGLLCPHCDEKKPKKDFPPKTYVSPSTGYASNWCKPCRAAYQRAYLAARKLEPTSSTQVETAKKKARASRVGWYGLTLEDYEQLLALQGGVCAGCGRPPNPGRSLDIDHKHQPGDKKLLPFERASRVRGLLCHLCNRVLGILRDNPETFQNLADYLTKPPALVIIRPKLEELLKNIDGYLAHPPAQDVLKVEKDESLATCQPPTQRSAPRSSSSTSPATLDGLSPSIVAKLSGPRPQSVTSASSKSGLATRSLRKSGP